VSWEVEYTDEFAEWWLTLSEEEQISVDATVQLLEQRGPQLPSPHSSSINGSKHSHMRELRTQHKGRPYRTLYALIRDEQQFCSWAVIKPAKINGMKRTCR